MAIISISDSQVNSADQILVADSNSKIPAKDGSQITILNATNVSSGTIATARLDTGTAAGKLVVLDGSGNLPVVDGSLLTGIVSATISASDPTISTNPSGGLGTEWLNSTSGEMYILTDATAGANVWKNVGAGEDNIPVSFNYQGSLHGYSMGGYRGAYTNVIDRFSFTTDGDAADVGDMTVNKISSVGHGDGSYGYAAGGHSPGNADMVERFAFGSSSNAVDIGNLSANHSDDPGSSQDATHGYVHGGSSGNVIDRYAFGSSVTGTDVGDILWGANGIGGACSPEYGYAAGGNSSSASQIQKYSFAASGNSTDVGDLVRTTTYVGENANSQTHGYLLGGYAAAYLNDIQKWAYASDANSTDVGNLVYTGNSTNGASSLTHAYCVGGGNAAAQYQNIQKVPFATDGNSTSVGDLTANAETSLASCSQ